MTLRNIQDLELKGRKVFVRVDFNVPLKGSQVADTFRLETALPTLGRCLESGAALVLASHLGRPKGGPDPAFSMKPVAERLQTLLGLPVAFVEDCIGPKAEAAKADLSPGEVLLLENLRFHDGEKKNHDDFARELAKGCDLYLTEAFAAMHRAHASVVGVPKVLGNGAVGLLVEKEVRELGALLGQPERPFFLVLGGAKVEDKVPVIQNLLPRVDKVLLGGALAYAFLKARGQSLGATSVEEGDVEAARRVEKVAAERKVEILLPSDHLVEGSAGQIRVAHNRALGPEDVPQDIGPETRQRYAAALRDAQTILWNGPLGVFEDERFAQGTQAVGRAIAECKGKTVAGGGDSVAALRQLGLLGRIGHVSTGGGAMLEFLSGVKLPGLTALGA